MDKESKIRPPLLGALCVLTFIGSTFAFIVYFVASLFFQKTSELIIKYSSWHSTDDISPLYFTILMVLFAISLTGAIRMWKRHLDGFFLYSISQIIILFLPVIWIGWQSFSTTNAVATVIFIVGYGIHWKWLK
ncbi:MAG: hypothetical protein R3182_07820 [Draconibacterium sp.]|nr:hypothetical protein [Draconibacterium sp.]